MDLGRSEGDDDGSSGRGAVYRLCRGIGLLYRGVGRGRVNESHREVGEWKIWTSLLVK
jgi:hypothetical protein